MNEWTDTYNLKGFVIGNGVTDMYIDSDNQLMESLVNWNMIPPSLFKQMQASNCYYKWDKLDVPVNNAPECAGYYNQAMDLISDFNIYDLFRTQYNSGPSLSKEDRLRSVMVEGLNKTYLLGYTGSERSPYRRHLL